MRAKTNWGESGPDRDREGEDEGQDERLRVKGRVQLRVLLSGSI